ERDPDKRRRCAPNYPGSEHDWSPEGPGGDGARPRAAPDAPHGGAARQSVDPWHGDQDPAPGAGGGAAGGRRNRTAGRNQPTGRRGRIPVRAVRRPRGRRRGL
ncbi:MAG: LSU ribosomal protein L30p (L7e), partial [uncultured Thermomicrobiales bacterium]